MSKRIVRKSTGQRSSVPTGVRRRKSVSPATTQPDNYTNPVGQIGHQESRWSGRSPVRVRHESGLAGWWKKLSKPKRDMVRFGAIIVLTLVFIGIVLLIQVVKKPNLVRAAVAACPWEQTVTVSEPEMYTDQGWVHNCTGANCRVLTDTCTPRQSGTQRVEVPGSGVWKLQDTSGLRSLILVRWSLLIPKRHVLTFQPAFVNGS